MKHQPRVLGSQQPDFKLVSHKPAKTKLQIILLGLFLFGASFSVFYAGYYVALLHQDDAMVHRDLLLKDAQSLDKQLAELKQQSAIYEQDAELSRQAAEIVRKENKSLLDRLSDLEKANVLYHRVLTPEKDDKGLAIGQLELKSTSDKQRFRYNFNLMQVSGRQRVKGIVYITLFGVIDGVKSQIKLSELPASKMKQEGISVGFRNFQSIDGELVLREGFTPERVEIVTQFSGRKTVRLRKVYDWSVEESHYDVGQG